jgi:hypothetical protein
MLKSLKSSNFKWEQSKKFDVEQRLKNSAYFLSVYLKGQHWNKFCDTNAKKILISQS